jgi:predicted nucleic acid-binding protein
VIAADTSVVVAAFASWHEDHEAAVEAIKKGVRLIGHVAFETYSVLTRMPAPLRVAPELVLELLTRNFPEQLLTLPALKQHALLSRLVANDIGGGAVYDALVGATAAHAGATLVTLDRRAVPTYSALGISVQVLKAPP